MGPQVHQAVHHQSPGTIQISTEDSCSRIRLACETDKSCLQTFAWAKLEYASKLLTQNVFCNLGCGR